MRTLDALLVHEAFDQGEYIHPPLDKPQGERRTDALLDELFANGRFSPTRWRSK